MGDGVTYAIGAEFHVTRRGWSHGRYLCGAFACNPPHHFTDEPEDDSLERQVEAELRAAYAYANRVDEAGWPLRDGP